MKIKDMRIETKMKIHEPIFIFEIETEINVEERLKPGNQNVSTVI